MLLCTLVSKIHSGKNLKETNYLFYGFRPVLIRVEIENILNSISFNNKGKFSIRDSSYKLITFPINSFFTAFKKNLYYRYYGRNS